MIANIGHNGMTRDAWLYAILNSGEVTRIAQHLALVIYHLSDPSTNTAKLSARDLERITGWGRTSIIEHLDEIEIYIRVKWGQGRAKALFELQGIIADVVEPMKKAAREAEILAATKSLADRYVRAADTRTDTTADTTPCVREVDTTADTKVYGQPDGHKNVVQQPVVSATWTQRGREGGIIGGEGGGPFLSPIKDSPNARVPANAVVIEASQEPPSFQIHADGSFSGTAFEHFSAVALAGFRGIYTFLEFPAELVAADQTLAASFDREGVPFGSPERMARLHQYLAKRNRDASTAVQAAIQDMRSKTQVNNDESCWFEEDKLMVANGFRAELLELVGGSEQRLRITLDKAAGSVPLDLKGTHLRKTVRSQFTRFADWGHQDERKTAAYERRHASSPTGSQSSVESPQQRMARLRAQSQASKGAGDAQ